MKKVIITGAGGGLGSAICQRCVKEGFHVIAIDIDDNSLKFIQHLPNTEFIIMDITNYKEVQAFFKNLILDNTVYSLINNAGIYNALSLTEYDEALIDDILNINIKGATICSKFFIETILTTNNTGKTVNISSISGQEGSSDALYGLTKAAIIGLTKSLALRYSPQILVNVIAPTMIDTKMMDKIPDWRKAEYNSQHLIKEPLTPNDVANTVNFLLSDESNHYTGATFDLNNGGYLR